MQFILIIRINNMNVVPYPFPRTLNVAQWEKYLGRKLIDEEYSLIESVRDERDYNKDLEKLYDITKKKGLYIAKLTPRNGNCLFESLNALELCENQDNFRKFLAHIMYMYKDYKNFFSYDARTLREMFNDTNEIEYVISDQELIVYKYTYETMCQDFASGFSWTRLPTQLIIQIISVLMNVRFEIFSNMSEYVNVLNANSPDSKPRIIYLGHIGEKHYVPLDKRIGKPQEDICPKYGGAKKTFYEWALMMEQSLNFMMGGGGHQEQHHTREPPKMKDTNKVMYTEITKPINGTENRVDFE
jgi:hypothetical protein